MVAINRREFGCFSAAAFALAMTEAGRLHAATPTAAAAAEPLAIDERLAPIAPELRPAARRMLELGLPPITAEVLRTLPADAGAPPIELLPGVPVSERQIPTQGALPGVKVFIVNASSTGQRPAILHAHGGGFILGSARTELRYLQQIAQALDCVIVSVEYRLSPAARYTESTEDTYAGLKWLHTHAEELGVDRLRIALLGESAGGGHAAMLAIKARDRGEIPLVLQALVYPMLDDRTGSTGPIPPHIATVGWSAPENRLGWESFLGLAPGDSIVPASAAPARLERLDGLAPAWIGVGGVDLFVNEDMEYARRLTLAGVPTELLVIPGGFHGFDRMAPETALAQRFTKAKLNALRRAFGSEVLV